MLSILLYQMLVHRHSNFVNLSKYDALLSLEASKVYCRHCLTRIFSVTFRPVTPLRRLPLNSAVQDWFIKNGLTCCQHAFYKEILVVMLLFKYFANLFSIFLNLKNNNNCTRQGCCFFRPILLFYSSYSVFLQLRQTVRRFCAEKLAPHADDIDKTNEFPRMRVSCIEEFITLIQRLLLAWITSAFSWTWWRTLTVWTG